MAGPRPCTVLQGSILHIVQVLTLLPGRAAPQSPAGCMRNGMPTPLGYPAAACRGARTAALGGLAGGSLAVGQSAAMAKDADGARGELRVHGRPRCLQATHHRSALVCRRCAAAVAQLRAEQALRVSTPRAPPCCMRSQARRWSSSPHAPHARLAWLQSSPARLAACCPGA